ncbi:MAG: hypothetical protein IJD92_00325 [Bacilli bacterium]|nr:hypothetical protein [Bacilli bacterium]
MNRGKLIVIEGTDCSGKETQSNLLIERLKKDNIKIEKRSFPMYDTPTGHIIGADLLGKPHMGKCIFSEGASNIPPKVAALYYAADRLYNIGEINKILDSGTNLILDRYVESNMGHQAGKLKNKQDKLSMMEWLEKLEFDLLELPKPDLVLFLYMPHQYSIMLRNKRNEVADEVEQDVNYLKNAELTYSLMAEKYNYNVIHCVKNDEIRTIEDINDDVYKLVKEKLS